MNTYFQGKLSTIAAYLQSFLESNGITCTQVNMTEDGRMVMRCRVQHPDATGHIIVLLDPYRQPNKVLVSVHGLGGVRELPLDPSIENLDEKPDDVFARLFPLRQYHS